MHPDVKLLSLELMGLFGEMEVFLNENSEFDDRETVLDLYFKIRDFLYVSDRLDEITGYTAAYWRMALLW